MCGLVGMLGNIMNAEKKAFRDLLVFDQVRGFDSTGVAAVALRYGPNVKNRHGAQVLKALGAAQNLWDYDYKGHKNFMDSRGVINGTMKCLIGHNRAATVGSVTAKNAHPFRNNHIVGAHNGSLRDWKDLHKAQKYDVDSKALFSDIAKYGVESTWKTFTGAAAITFWDESNGTLSMVRNHERPLWLCESAAGDCLFWASEKWMLQVALNRNKISVKRDSNGLEHYWSLPVDKLHVFEPLANGYNIVEVRDLEKKYQTGSSVQISGQKPSITNTYGSKPKQTVVGTLETLDKIDTEKFHEFKNNNWDHNTVDSDIDYLNAVLTNFRPIKRAGFGGMANTAGYEWVFRATITSESLSKNSKSMAVASVDICPQTEDELQEMIELVFDQESGHTIDAWLCCKPKERASSSSNRVFANLVCTTSQVGWYITPKKSEQVEEEVEKEFLPIFLGPNNTWVDKETYKSMLKEAGDSCCWCTDSVTEDTKGVEWLSRSEVLCPECVSNWGGQIHLLRGNAV